MGLEHGVTNLSKIWKVKIWIRKGFGFNQLKLSVTEIICVFNKNNNLGLKQTLKQFF